MKKLIVLLITVTTLISCQKDKKEGAVSETPKKHAASLEIDGIYEKDDSLVVYYMEAGNYQYYKPVVKIVKGSALTQKLVFDMPEGVAVENFSIVSSTNKEQDHITITNISIKDGDNVIDGSNYKYAENFMTDESFKWDEKKSNYMISHSNKYPPGIVGKEKLTALLVE